MKIKRSNGKKRIRVTSRNKEQTKRLFLDAAAEIIKKEGIKNLAIHKIATVAGRSKRMIYDYFGSMEGVIKSLMMETDHWLSYEDKMEETILIHQDDKGKELAGLAMKRHFQQFYTNTFLQEISILELSDAQNYLTDVTEKREQLANDLFAISEDHFSHTDVHFRSVCAILFGGINYMVLHSKARNKPLCGININDSSHQEKFKKTIEQITKWAYDHADKKHG